MKNAPKILLAAILLLNSGCGLRKPCPEPSPAKLPLAIAKAKPVDLKPVTFHVVTRENANEVFDSVKASGEKEVLFTLTTDNYRNLSVNIEEIKNYILFQQGIIDAYKKYYEPAPVGK